LRKIGKVAGRRCYQTKRWVGRIFDRNYGNVKRAYCLFARSYGKITGQQIEEVRRFLKRWTKNRFKKTENKLIRILIRIYPYLGLTKKPLGTRMGGGKGVKIRGWVCCIRPGKSLFEVENVPFLYQKKLLGKISSKLSIQSKVFFYKEI